MRLNQKSGGFSLMEVNMAIFVMAVGVLSIVALFPLGVRESTQSQSDLKQSMFADYMLSALVSAASNPGVSWNEWGTWARNHSLARSDERDVFQITGLHAKPRFPGFLDDVVIAAADQYNNSQSGNITLVRDKSYAVYCVPVPGDSSLIMGILVRSLHMDTSDMNNDECLRRLESQPVYYAEVRFQGTIP